MKVRRTADSQSQPADASQFFGDVRRTTFIAAGDGDGLGGLRFDYAPGAHSHWHIHEREQAIVGVEGRGLVFWEGLDAPVEIGAGDWWHVTPGVPHWHGATPDSSFSHLAISTGGETEWIGEVTDEDYRSGED